MSSPLPSAPTPGTRVQVYGGDAPEWDTFVRRTPGGTFFHLLGWREVLEQAFGFRPHYLVARRGAHLVGVLPLCEVRSALRGRRLLSLPFAVEGGVCALDGEAQRALEDAALDLSAEIGAERIELRDSADGGRFATREGVYFRFRRAVFATDEENLAAMRPKQRRMVRVGQHSDLVARVDADDLEIFYHLFAHSMRRLGTPVFARRYFRLLRSCFGDDCVLLVVRHGSVPVAGVVSFFFGDAVLPYYAGSRREFFRYAVNDFMYWELMRYARQRGAQVFDFGRSKRGTGPYEFKRHWGCTPEPLRYRVWAREGPPAPMGGAAAGVQFLRRAWQRMPLALTRLLGPALVRHFGVYYTDPMAALAASDCALLPRYQEDPAAVGRRRVLMVAFHYPPANTPGALRTLKFSKYLGEQGWDASVLTVAVRRCATPDAALLEQIRSEIRVYRTPCFDSKAVFAIRGRYPALIEVPDRYVSWLPLALRRALRIIREDDIHAVFSTSPIPTAHLVALGIKVVTGLPWVADFRDPWSARPGRGRLQRRIDERLERAVVGRADRVLTVTPPLAEQLCALHGDAMRRKIHVIYNGYDEDDFVAPAVPKASEEEFRLIHAGHLYPEFRQPTALLQALRRCIDAGTIPPDLRLHFLGDGQASPLLTRQIADLRLDHVVCFSARIAHHAALAAMTSSSALVLLQGGANTLTQLPSKCFEYLRTGRPLLVLAPAGSATDDALRGFTGVYRADADDVVGIAVALGRIYEQWKRGTRVIDRRGPNLERFERRRATQALAEVLDTLVAEQTPRAK